MINKHMYFYWGNKTLSWMRYLTLYSFRKLNPDWKMILYLTDLDLDYKENKSWQDSPIQDFHTFTGEDYFRKVFDLDIDICKYEFIDLEKKAGPSYRSNFFKWKMLSKNSGYYSDLDILYTSPIETFYNETKESNVIICHNGFYFSIGLLGSSGRNKFFTDVYESSLKSYDPQYYQSAGVKSLYFLLVKVTKNNNVNLADGMNIFEKAYSNLHFYNFSMNTVYPWPCYKLSMPQMVEVFEHKHETLPIGCCGIHWYAGDATAQKYNNILNERNYQNFNNTFCYQVKKLLG